MNTYNIFWVSHIILCLTVSGNNSYSSSCLTNCFRYWACRPSMHWNENVQSCTTSCLYHSCLMLFELYSVHVSWYFFQHYWYMCRTLKWNWVNWNSYFQTNIIYFQGFLMFCSGPHYCWLFFFLFSSKLEVASRLFDEAFCCDGGGRLILCLQQVMVMLLRCELLFIPWKVFLLIGVTAKRRILTSKLIHRLYHTQIKRESGKMPNRLHNHILWPRNQKSERNKSRQKNQDL